jgi:hypothetical protein
LLFENFEKALQGSLGDPKFFGQAFMLLFGNPLDIRDRDIALPGMHPSSRRVHQHVTASNVSSVYFLVG